MQAHEARIRLVDTTTGEVVEEDERDLLIEQLQADLKGKQLAVSRLKRELKELRAVEPEAQTIREILEYWRSRCLPGATLAIGGKRWEKVRARLKDKLDDREPWTPGELRLAVDGALLDPWLSGRDRHSRGYLDAETIFRDAEQVERLRDLALGFKAQAGAHLGDLIDVADELRIVEWKPILRICVCGHRRIEHRRPDPDLHGFEGCLECECPDFADDVLNELWEQQPRRLNPWKALNPPGSAA